MMRARPAVDRFAEKVALASSGCLEWIGCTNNTGYGTFAVGDGVSTVAHRWSYEHHRGPIPSGLYLDHLCRNRLCVNPDHLEPVTQRINLHRGRTNATKTHCPYGHPYSGDNLYLAPSGGRGCNTCIHARSLARSDKKVG